MKTLASFLRWVLMVARTLAKALSTILSMIFGPPIAALNRWIHAAARWVWDRILRFLQAWGRIFHPAHKQPRDHPPTPGAPGLVLIAATVTWWLWLVIPAVDLLDSIPVWRVVLAQLVTFGVIYAYLRYAVREHGDSPWGSQLVDVACRAGLFRLEWLLLLVSLLAIRALTSQGITTVVPLLLIVGGVLRLMASPNEQRKLGGDLPSLRPLPEGDDDNTGDLVTFEWASTGDGPRITTVIRVDRVRAERMRLENPERPMNMEHPDFTEWVVNGWTPEVYAVAAAVREASISAGNGVFGEAASVLRFVQAIDYSLDEDTTGILDYWRYPIETLADRTGDCEDTAILAAAVLLQLGHDVLPVVTTNHAALAVRVTGPTGGHSISLDGADYYYCETTSEGFNIGDLPAGVSLDDLTPCPLRQGTPPHQSSV